MKKPNQKPLDNKAVRLVVIGILILTVIYMFYSLF